MTNCPNCGAPFTGGKCAYCGTERAEERREYRSRLEQTATGISLIVEPLQIPPAERWATIGNRVLYMGAET